LFSFNRTYIIKYYYKSLNSKKKGGESMGKAQLAVDSKMDISNLLEEIDSIDVMEVSESMMLSETGATSGSSSSGSTSCCGSCSCVSCGGCTSCG
jgi:Thiopeptide-type bacteriocin precursor